MKFTQKQQCLNKPSILIYTELNYKVTKFTVIASDRNPVVLDTKAPVFLVSVTLKWQSGLTSMQNKALSIAELD